MTDRRRSTSVRIQRVLNATVRSCETSAPTLPISGVPRDHARGKPEAAGLVPIAQFGAAVVHAADGSEYAGWYRRVAPRRWLRAAAKRALDMTMKEMTLTVR